MKSWKYNNGDFELEINVFSDVIVCVYHLLKDKSFQVRMIKLDDRPIFPSDDEEVAMFCKTHFFQIL